MTGTSISDLGAAFAFLRSMPAFLRRPLTLEQAAASLRRRLAHRETDFLDLMDRAVYSDPGSPYSCLLAMAGCEQGDLKKLMSEEGLEGTLKVLARNGVFLTVDEFKGRRPVKRGSSSFTIRSQDLQSPISGPHLPAHTGGSGGAPSLVSYGIESMRDRAVNILLSMSAQKGESWVKAVWGVSAGSAPVVMRYSLFGCPVARWFVQVRPDSAGLHPCYRWVSPAIRIAALIAGVDFPRPEHVPLTDPLPIARWMAEILRSGRVPHLYSFFSPIVRLCREAHDAGIDLRGARFTATGEPATAGRLAEVRAVGAEIAVDYGSVDAGGPVSQSCLCPEEPDDVHFFEDLHAVVQPDAEKGSALPPKALLLTSLRTASPLVLLNVSMGDQADLTRRSCGCPLDRLGWNLHLQNIRSFEKLTAAGMTFLDTDVVRILEEALPARFGGRSDDYQLVEEEDARGNTHIILAVHPRVGPVDETAVRTAFLDCIGSGRGAERIMSLQWRQSGFPHIERRIPALSGKGKVLHIWRNDNAERTAEVSNE
jgi:hypothetical protein